MFLDATLLIQDVQLLCFTVVFGVLAMQRWSDPMRRWLFYGFLANAAGAGIDLASAHLPLWITHGLNQEMIPLSYAMLNVALTAFTRRRSRAVWLSVFFVVAALPFFLLWANRPSTVRSDALGDFVIALESLVACSLLFASREQATRAPRMLLGIFLNLFTIVELSRVWVAFVRNGDPDVTTPHLQFISAVAYVVNVSLLPLTFLWMMQARTEGHLLHQSIIDPLTGVLNRRGLEQALARELARSQRFGHPLTLVILDLDHFKTINDRHGHGVGDAILSGVAAFVEKRIRKTDTLARFGGEEFVLLLPHLDLGAARPMVEELRLKLEESEGLMPSGSRGVTGSFGVAASSPGRPLSGDRLLHEADIALYQAKNNGRNQVGYFATEDVVLVP